ncbi:Pex12 amino terminal region-domain-containing protein [Xylogone sp. PMI_703]|nr:Pex12 amino terminal region-domain-containing protein [Xylogone sp. PMI_703]
MADHVADASLSSSESKPTYSYPFAAPPDIIRAHQKDAYFEGVLTSHLSTFLRRIYGARFVHTYASEAQTFSELLYLGLTTFIGNRTLGEEYCDIIQVEDDTGRLPELYRRAGYILTSVLVPYGLHRILPGFRARVRAKLESNLRRLSRNNQEKSFSFWLQNYLLDNLNTITSPAPLHALTLAVFYFSGSYYQLSKRIFGLRYIFTKRINPSEARVGYEVLGVLLVLQLGVQAYLHLQSTLRSLKNTNTQAEVKGTVGLDNGANVSLSLNKFTTNNELLFSSGISGLPLPANALSQTTHTPVLPSARYDLAHDDTMKWVKGKQARKCTLCLEELKDPSAALCGHVFCWTCISDWVKEKEECPLCRRELKSQHVLPLRG